MKKKLSENILNIIYILFGIVLFCTPFIFDSKSLFPFTTSKTLFFLYFCQVIIILFISLFIIDDKYKPKKNNIIYCFFIFVIINIISSILGVSPIFSFWSSSFRADGVILLIHIFLFLLVLISTINTKKILNKFILISVLASFFVAIFAFLGTLGIKISDSNYLFTSIGLLGNDSYTATYLLFNLYFLVYLFFETNNKKKKLLLGVMFFLILCSPFFINFDVFRGAISFSTIINNPMIILGTARGATISFILSIILVIILFINNFSNKIIFIISKTFTGLFFAFLISVVILSSINGTSLNKWFDEKTGGYRSIYWSQSIEAFKERPILGWGTNNFRSVNEKYFDSVVFSMDGERYSDKAHNIIFDTLVSVGIVGLLSYLSIFVSGLIFLWKSKNMSHISKSIFSGLMLAYFLQNLIFFDFLMSYVMFVFLLAIIIINDSSSRNINLNFTFLKKNNFIIISPFLIIIGFISIRYFVLLPLQKIHDDYSFYKLPAEIRGKLYINNSDDISLFGVKEDKKIYAYSIISYYNTMGNIDKIRSMENIDPYILDLDGMINNMERSYDPKNKDFYENYLIYQLYQAKFRLTDDKLVLDKLEEYGKKQIDFATDNQQGYLDYGYVLFNKEKYLESLDVLERGLDLNIKNIVLHKYIIKIVQKMNDLQLIEEKIQRAEKNFPGINFR